MKDYIFKNLSFGYMPSFNADLISEIQFASKYFDFVEITSQYNFKEYSDEYWKIVKQSSIDFKVLGHLHWEVDLGNTDEALNSFQIFRFLNAQKITLHPTLNANWNEMIDFCRKNKLNLLVENSGTIPFNSPEEFKELFKRYPFLTMTLDIGHCGFVSKQEYQKYLRLFADKIKHIHLHYNKDKQFDHLAFKDKTELKNILCAISNLGVKQTVTLEIFNDVKNGESVALNSKERQQCILQELASIKKFKI